MVMEGVRLNADALTGNAPGVPIEGAVRIEPGYRTGLISRVTEMHARYYARTAAFGQAFESILISRVTEMHARYYARTAAFGQAFESIVATGLAEFCGRLINPSNGIWAAVEGESIVGSVAIDGEDLGPEIAHLRWFIVEDGRRGLGIGRNLLSRAIAFAEERGFVAIHLWTCAGLDAARHLYEAHGFACVEERLGAQWGSEVLEQRFVRRMQ